MNRDELFAIARATGWKAGQPMTQPQRAALRAAVQTALTDPALADVQVQVDAGKFVAAKDATDLLLEEFQ